MDCNSHSRSPVDRAKTVREQAGGSAHSDPPSSIFLDSWARGRRTEHLRGSRNGRDGARRCGRLTERPTGPRRQDTARGRRALAPRARRASTLGLRVRAAARRRPPSEHTPSDLGVPSVPWQPGLLLRPLRGLGTSRVPHPARGPRAGPGGPRLSSGRGRRRRAALLQSTPAHVPPALPCPSPHPFPPLILAAVCFPSGRPCGAKSRGGTPSAKNRGGTPSAAPAARLQPILRHPSGARATTPPKGKGSVRPRLRRAAAETSAPAATRLGGA